MDQASSGEVYYKNRNLTQASEASLTRFRREEVGFVFQFYNLIPDLTAKENVEIAADLVDNPLLVNECLKDVELYDRMNHFPSQMSGGEQQRISIARALVKTHVFYYVMNLLEHLIIVQVKQFFHYLKINVEKVVLL